MTSSPYSAVQFPRSAVGDYENSIHYGELAVGRDIP